MNSLSSFLAHHDALLLFFCSLLFGIAFGLGHERGPHLSIADTECEALYP